ncbi:hypothetical protein [Labilithrix luteola]|uniref:hypothetical protein n=1 Tax=Labilithrix luteola TaxID=1391654 RepID=UPI0011BA7A42|nr:hypothetical protein [Labilithrix luteola]
MKTSNVVAVFTAAATVMAWGCSRTQERLGAEIGEPPPVFAALDAGSDATPDARGLTNYCPSNKCPPGWMTCPDSRFPCDTNIASDPHNCGGCGLDCSRGGPGATFVCNEGACTMSCTSGALDCDGIVDNGCESRTINPTSCGGCGVVCAVGESCRYQDDTFTTVACGCPPGKLDCQGCKDVVDDDSHCGACNNACDRTGGPDAPQYANSYYGCASSQCGKVKCKAGFGNCDGDIENGCETSTIADDNCGACGNKCGAGQKCAVDAVSNKLACLCEEGLTFCQTGEVNGIPKGSCVDVRSDQYNCGACGVDCGSFIGDGYSTSICDYGRCLFRCTNGAADCNGSRNDGCEIDTNSDPRNCGGCGITCDLTMGQACVAGKCVVEPCDQADAGEVTR